MGKGQAAILPALASPKSKILAKIGYSPLRFESFGPF